MSSNIEIKKKCKWCGQIFIAHKTTTNYCSHRCNKPTRNELDKSASLLIKKSFQ